MKEKKGFVLYMDNYHAIRELSDRQKGLLIEALFLFARETAQCGITSDAFFAEHQQEFFADRETAIVFLFMAESIFRDTKKWRAIVEAKEAKRREREELERLEAAEQELQERRELFERERAERLACLERERMELLSRAEQEWPGHIERTA